MEEISREADSAEAQKYLIFMILEKRYALPSRIISEVAALEKVFPLPLVPPFVRGIINRYSIPYALVDVSLILGGDSAQGSKVIVFKEETDRLALLIDDVVDFADLPPSALMDVDQEAGAAANLVRAFFEWKGNPVFCLESDELLRHIQQEA
ncbi:MAG: chemotaxis protein CheW [Spirochaetota bacterium]|jgi:purine-binding chemotaxis protein CheW|nr:chemotaxis protein CheW [Spirochaetota bacterium]